MSHFLFSLLLGFGCSNDIKLTAQASCDGVLQPDEDGAVDSPFDVDGDGFFDAANPSCAETYAPEFLDCNDGDPTVSPGAAEQTCDGIDNDCDELTPDAIDDDGDGASVCDDDCDDTDAERSPDFDEVCGDSIDNNCDGDVDELCSYTGVWSLDRNISYQCASFFGIYFVDIGFNAIYIDDLGSSLTVAPTNGSSQPGTTYGTFSSDTAFSTTTSVSGGCTETYTFSGTFLDSNTFSGTFEADFDGRDCLDCTYQSVLFSATR